MLVQAFVLTLPFLLEAVLPRVLDCPLLPLRVVVLASSLGWTWVEAVGTGGVVVVVAGGAQSGWVGYGHIPAGWSSEWQTEQLNILTVRPSLFTSVTNFVLLMMSRHSLIAVWLVVGG